MTHYARWIEFLGGSVKEVGWVMGAGALVGLLLRPWMGQWINHLGAKTTWLLGYLVFAIGSVGNLGLVDLGLAIYALRSMIVLGAALVFASSLTYISQVAPVQRRTEAIGILGVGGFLGMVFGPALGDLLLGGDIRQRSDFAALFLIAGIGNIVPSVLLCFMQAPPRSAVKSALGLVDFLRTVWQHWPGTILLVDLAFGVCMAIPFGFLASYIDGVPLSLDGVSTIGLFFWCYAGWGLTIRIWLRRLPERVGRRKVLLAGMCIMTVGMMSYLLVDASRPWMLVVPALLTGTAHSLMFHTMTSLTIESFPSAVRGTGSALALMMLDCGMIAGAPPLGAIAEYWGFQWMYLAIALIMLLTTCAYWYSSLSVWKMRRQAAGGTQRSTAVQRSTAASPAGPAEDGRCSEHSDVTVGS